MTRASLASDFRQSLLAQPPTERDAWLSRALGLEEIPGDIDLPRGCVPYLPASVDSILRAVDEVPVTAEDVFVDVGSGAGRAAALVQLLSGAHVVCVELQPQLLQVSRELFQRLGSARVTHVLGDAIEQLGSLQHASVFFLYCPFSGSRLRQFLEGVRPLARKRRLSVVTVDLPLPQLDWLEEQPTTSAALQIYRSLRS